jgi:hypothetical protein
LPLVTKLELRNEDKNDLVYWLDRECRQRDIIRAILVKCLLALMRNLQAGEVFGA